MGRFLPLVTVRDFSALVTGYAQLNARVRPETVIYRHRAYLTTSACAIGGQGLNAGPDVTYLPS